MAQPANGWASDLARNQRLSVRIFLCVIFEPVLRMVLQIAAGKWPVGVSRGRRCLMASHSFSSAVVIATIVSVVIPGCRDSGASSRSSGQAANANKAAWQVALKAESEPIFRDARYLLSQIDMGKVTDQDVGEIIIFQQRFYNFCIDTGVPRDVKMDIQGVLSSINYTTLGQTLINRGITNAHHEARRLADEGAALAAGLDKYFDVRKVLVKRYGGPNG